MLMTRYTIELLVPSDVDPSELLERAQQLVTELADTYRDDDDENDDAHGQFCEELENEVRVTLVAEKAA